MDLLEFSRSLPTDFTEAEFIDEPRKVVDLDQISIYPTNANMYDAGHSDYLILREFYQKSKTSGGYPLIEYRAPVIWNQLTRDLGEEPDFTQLTSFARTGSRLSASYTRGWRLRQHRYSTARLWQAGDPFL